MQEWDGFVIGVKPQSFTARLTDLTGKGLPDGEEVEIPVEELDDDSKAHLAAGRMFRWSIGYEKERSGQKKRISRILFRRFSPLTRTEVDQAQQEADTLYKALRWE